MKEIVRIALVVLAAFSAFIIWSVEAEHASFSWLIKNLTLNLFPFRNENIFIVGGIRGRSLFLYAYAIAILSAVIILFSKDFFKEPVQGRKRDKAVIVPSVSVFFASGVAVFCLISGLQLAYQINYFKSEMGAYSGKTEDEKNALKFDATFKFARFCKDKLPGKHSAAYISDYSVDEPTGLMLRYRVAYFIYPINIRIPADDPVDAYVVFQKKDPELTVPAEYSKRFLFSPADLIAIKEGIR